MKRIPLISSFILFLALCATAAYWTMQFLQPPPRAIVAPMTSAPIAAPISAAESLFGGKTQISTASNFQVTGIIVADRASESVAILSVDGKPAKPFRANAEIQAGVRVQEVRRDHVLLEKNGTVQRLELPIAHK